MRARPLGAVAVVILAGVVGIALSACGGGSKATQVAVKVNKDEITVLQINEQLARLPSGIPADQIESAKAQVIGRLVTQQLLAQQALERKLDRDPSVLGALEEARLNILAQAYVQRVVAEQAKPTDQEIRKYYADNPDLFAQRKVYRLQELVFSASPEQQKAIEAAASGKSLKRLAEYLNEHKIAFSSDNVLRAAEQLPLVRLPEIAQLKNGEVLVYALAPGRVSAIEVLATDLQPVDEKKAYPVIEKYLTNLKSEQLAENEIKRLRDTAKIEYVGDFAKYASVLTPARPAGPAKDKAASGEQEKGIAALH